MAGRNPGLGVGLLGVFCSGSGEEMAGQKVMVRGGQIWKLFKKLN